MPKMPRGLSLSLYGVSWQRLAPSRGSAGSLWGTVGDSIGQHGPDGVLVTDLGFAPFVPEGRSLWEIGTRLKAGNKATCDYNARTKDTPENVRRESTFVFVTPLSGRRDWEHTWKEDAQGSWLDDRCARGDWKDVRVIDGTKLIDWLHQFPAVELWLAQVIGGLPEQQVETLEQHWSDLRSIGEPPSLTPDVFLANRDEACAKLKEVFDDAVVQLKLTTHFPDQVTDFVSAYVASLDTDSYIDAVSRCLIISGVEAWNAICTQRNRLVLVADSALDLNGEAGTRLIQKARRAGHAVVFGGPRGGIPDPASVQLHTPRIHQVQEALEKAGYSEERARTLAQKSDGNLGSLLRCLQKLPLPPEWAEGTDASELAIAVLLGSWRDGAQADRHTVKGIVGKAYGGWIETMREVALRPATPLVQHEGSWEFTARYEGWYALGPRLFDEHLDRLWDAAVHVLSEKDPQFELPPEERYMASIHGKVLAHSRLLRKGLAESLTLVGSHPNALTSCTRGKPETAAVLAVREILSDADWVLWASLDSLLPLLAEAAPQEFLDAVESSLRTDPCPFDELLAQESGGVLGRTYMSGLLWALETLAWEADYLVRVIVLLGELARHDSGGQWMNRPGNSLTTILLPWLPQTCAPLANRVAAVKALLSEFPDVGWKLLLSLLPKSHSVSHRTRRPAWRATIPEGWREGVTHQEYQEQVSSYSELAIEQARTDARRLGALVDHLDNLPQPVYDQILDRLASNAVRTMPEADRLVLWNKLDDLVRKHRRFADADWAMKPDQVERIAAIAEQLSPADPFFRHQRLFEQDEVHLYEEQGDYAEQSRKLDDRRIQVVEEIAAAGSTQAVLELAKSVEAPWRVGNAYGTVASEQAEAVVLPALLESDQEPLFQFAAGYVRARFRNRGWQWVDSINTSQWTAAAVGQFLSFLPFTQETWKRAQRLLGEDESAYWTKVRGYAFQAESGLEFAIERLLRYGRPYAAIRCLHRILRDQQSLDTELAARALLQAAQSSESPQSMDVYQIVEIIKALQDHPGTDADDLFRIEWAYLPLLDDHHDASPRLLERRLANEPVLFCEVIRLVFRSEEEGTAEELTEAQKNIAAHAYRLLHVWRTPPGYREDGSYDGAALADWVQAVKKECAESGHLEIAMTMLGHVLIYVPPDPDGLWIHRSAAAVLNSRDAEDMRNGFHAALYNSRGAHWVDPTGKPEKELAAKYRAQAEAVEEVGFHRLAATLRDLALTYERQAESIIEKAS